MSRDKQKSGLSKKVQLYSENRWPYKAGSDCRLLLEGFMCISGKSVLCSTILLKVKIIFRILEAISINRPDINILLRVLRKCLSTDMILTGYYQFVSIM